MASVSFGTWERFRRGEAAGTGEVTFRGCTTDCAYVRGGKSLSSVLQCPGCACDCMGTVLCRRLLRGGVRETRYFSLSAGEAQVSLLHEGAGARYHNLGDSVDHSGLTPESEL